MTVQFRPSDDQDDTDAPPDNLTIGNVDPNEIPADAIYTSGVRIAYRFETAYGDRFIHVFGLGWFVWASTHWKEARQGEVTRALLALIRKSWPEAQIDPGLETAFKDVQKAGADKALKWAKDLESFAHTADELDGNLRLVNLKNGTFDLDDMKCRPHRRADLMTKQMQASYNDNGSTWEQEAPIWKKFLERVLPDEATRNYLQMYSGTALSGEVLEHALAVLFGMGRNGKGVFYEALMYVFGTYALQADPALFMYREGAHTTSQADLLGKRFVVISETARGGKVNVALLKRIAGGDAITARKMRQDNITFDPTHTPFLVTNWMPRIPADEQAAWERVAVVPFDVYIPYEERDKQLKYKLRKEADGILKWLIEGWRMYRDNEYALPTPDAVRDATEEHREEVDYIGAFIEAMCVEGPGERVLQTTIREAYNKWRVKWDMVRDEAPEYTASDFSQVMKRRGITSQRAGKGSKWHFFGIRVKEAGRGELAPDYMGDQPTN